MSLCARRACVYFFLILCFDEQSFDSKRKFTEILDYPFPFSIQRSTDSSSSFLFGFV